MALIRIILSFFLAIAVGQVWSYSSTTAPNYDYDAIESILIHQNIEFEVKNADYDDTPNFHNCCSTFMSGDLQEKTRLGSFFALVGDFVVTKGGAKSGDKVYRVWGDGAGANGRSWSRTDPSKVKNYRNEAGLPDQNSGRFVTEGTLTNTKGVTQRNALPLNGNKGGLDELVVPDPAKQIRVDRVSGVNPEL